MPDSSWVLGDLVCNF